jgi:phosphoribosylformylglycinamidine cyclo-ligase
VTYRDAGVDICAGERAVELIRQQVGRASRPEVLGGIGGFAGLFRLDVNRWRQPVLATSTDGVGTKVALAQALDRHDTIGLDLVAMIVDDIVVCGAEPLFLTDYIACGQVVPERIAQIVAGVAAGCELAGCALIGGETAEHPGLLGPQEYDLAGAGVGVVEADAVLGPDRVSASDVVIALASSGVHANGYSLIRHVLLPRLALDSQPPELDGQSLGDVLLTPTRIYAPDCLALAAQVDVHAFAHVTGGGIADNLARVLPADVDAVVDRGSWTPPPVFDLIADRGDVGAAEMERTFNLGVGMVAVVSAAAADQAMRLLAGRGVPAWLIGELRSGTGTARLTGRHPH